MKRLSCLVLLSLWACTPPAPTPSPSPSPTATPTPAPVDNCCSIPGSEDQGWAVAAKLPPYNGLFLEQVEATMGDSCGKDVKGTLEALAEQLNNKGLCASVWADAVLVVRPDGYGEEWHAVAWGTGCWTLLSTAMKNTWYHANMNGACR